MKKGCFFVFPFYLLFLPCWGQIPDASVINNTLSNPVILTHYSHSELQNLSLRKLTAINYYYTESFLLDSIACVDCRTFDRVSFDVSAFEHLRLQSTRYIRDYNKYGYRLTLLSKDEMKYPPIR